MPRIGQNVATRERREFFLQHLRTVGVGEQCIHWPWSYKHGEYVRMSTGSGITYAHRWVWEQIHGPIPSDREICHNCPAGDSPSCVRPSHLWLGTHAENIRDGWAKGRMHANRKNHPTGEDHHAAKLTTEDVYRIRRLCDSGIVQRSLAPEYGVSVVTINHIFRRKTWRHLPEEDDIITPAAQA